MPSKSVQSLLVLIKYHFTTNDEKNKLGLSQATLEKAQRIFPKSLSWSKFIFRSVVVFLLGCFPSNLSSILVFFHLLCLPFSWFKQVKIGRSDCRPAGRSTPTIIPCTVFFQVTECGNNGQILDKCLGNTTYWTNIVEIQHIRQIFGKQCENILQLGYPELCHNRLDCFCFVLNLVGVEQN